MTISAPTGDLTADGTKTFPAVLSTGYDTTASPGTYNITYTKDGQHFDGTPTEAGAYTASVTVGEGNGAATASVSYTIAPSYTPGDANSDELVDVNDVMLMQQYIVNWDVDIDTTSADVDGDGEITIIDVMLTQQIIVGWEVLS